MTIDFFSIDKNFCLIIDAFKMKKIIGFVNFKFSAISYIFMKLLLIDKTIFSLISKRYFNFLIK